MSESMTTRRRAKAERRAALLDAAARLFARHGFDGVSLEDLGAAAGISGPAVYRHFAGKQAVLAALLVEASRRLLDGARQVVEDDPEPLRALIRFHTGFALAEPDVIRVQERDLAALADGDRHTVRELQRTYVELWVDVFVDVLPGADRAELRLRAQATFGLLNSTPFSVPAADPDVPADRAITADRARAVLEAMASAALTA